jgi:hypothetical protein
VNWVYVRSNGFTKPGWFGDVTPQQGRYFDPMTGAPDARPLALPAADAAMRAVLHAVSRGDAAAVRTVAPYEDWQGHAGLVSSPTASAP